MSTKCVFLERWGGLETGTFQDEKGEVAWGEVGRARAKIITATISSHTPGPANTLQGYFMRKQLKVNLKEFGNELE